MTIWTISWTNSIVRGNGLDYGGGSYQVEAHPQSTIELVYTPTPSCPNGYSAIDTSGLSGYNEFFTCGLIILGFKAEKEGCPEGTCQVDCATAPNGFCCISHTLTDRLLQVLQG